jgi:long-subunit fatty acid transport protein
MMRLFGFVPCVLALCVFGALVFAPSARAGGFELLPGGVRSVARGGAVAARAEDPMTLLHNPAGLSSLPGDRMMLNIDLPLHSMCFDAYGYYGWGVYSAASSEFGDPLDDDYAATPLPEVCNSAETLPLPSIAWAGVVSDSVTLGFGFVAPTIVPGLRFGGSDGTISVGGRAMPTPTRYLIIEQKVDFAFAPSFGLSYRFGPAFSLGANLTVAMLSARTWAIQNAYSGTQPSSDWLAEVEATDLFIPSLTVGALFEPTRALDVGIAFRAVDAFDGSGEVTYETNTFHKGATSGPIPFENDPIELKGVRVGLPSTITLAVRYAGLLGGEPKPDDDPMSSELWDVELDGSYTFNSLAGDNAVQSGDDVIIVSRVAGGGSSSPAQEALPEVTFDRHQLDSFAVRLGGSYSVVPRSFQVHAGGFFESRGVEAAYASIDSFAFARVGVGLGAMLRLGKFDLWAGYGHIFQETLEVVPPPHQNVEDSVPGDVTSGFDQRVGGSFNDLGVREGGRVLEDPSVPSQGDATAKLQQGSALPSPGRPERIINAGRYTASFDVISIAVQLRY